MNIETRGVQTHVSFDNYRGFRMKMLFSFEGILYISGAILFSIMAYTALTNGSIIGLLFALAATLVFFIAGWKYVSRITLKEVLVIEPHILTTITSSNGKTITTIFPVTELIAVRFIGFEAAIDHPLKSENFDYLGFQTQQQVVNSVTAEGNLSFEHADCTVRIGKGMPSWDAATLSALIFGKTNGQVMIEDLPEEIPEEVWQR